MSDDKAVEIPPNDCGLKITCGRDGVWLHFSSSAGKLATIHVESLTRDGLVGEALLAWCEDRRKQAARIHGGAASSAGPPPARDNAAHYAAALFAITNACTSIMPAAERAALAAAVIDCQRSRGLID
jgi:hypothetical protein